MIPNLVNDTTVTGSLGGRKKQMGVDPDAWAHIMSVLTDLYSDEEMAVIREYSTNARDAQTDAGVTRPIEVTTPSTFSPYFKVKDFGVGLTANEIQDVYAMYGTSTKRGCNLTNGMLGLGSKSALTYTNQFTVIAVKNGVKTSVSIYRDEEGTGSSEVVDTVATDEPNGVEVIIPTTNRNSFQEKAEKFFGFWAPGTVLLNGKQPAQHTDSLTKIEDGLFAERHASMYDSKTSYIVMGNVAYPIKDFHDKFVRDTTYKMRRFSMVAFVPMGAVNFTPNREALHYTDLTNRTIVEVTARWRKGMEEAAKQEILNAPDATTAWKLWDSWRHTFPFKSLAYKGMAFVDAVPHSHVEIDTRARRAAASSSSQFYLRTLEQSIFVHGFTLSSVTATYKKKIKQYLEEQGIENRYRYVILSDKRPTSPWLQGVKLVDFADIKAVVLPNASPNAKRGGSKKQVHYDWWSNESGTVTQGYQSPLPQNPGKMLYFSPTERYTVHPEPLLTGLPESVTIVMLAANRWDKFKRLHPNAEHARAYGYRRMTELDKVTDEYRKFMGINGVTSEFLRVVDPSQIDDPDIVEMAKFVQSYKPNDQMRARAQQVANGVNRYLPNVTPTPYDLLDTYPLLSGTRYNVRTNMAHIVTYINAIFNSKESK